MKFNHLNVPTHWQNYWTRYPEGHTILEALISWVSQVDDMVDNVNNWNTYLDDFVLQFDSELHDTLTTILSDWQTSGFLDVVINEALQFKIDGYIATNEDDKRLINEQLSKKLDKGNVSVSDINKNLGKFDQTYMSEEFLQQIAGGADINAVPADGSITTPKIAGKAVVIDHLSNEIVTVKRSDNRFNVQSEDVTIGAYMQAGNYIENTSYLTSHKIYAKKDDIVRYGYSSGMGGGHAIFVFDSSNNYLESQIGTPNGTTYRQATITNPDASYFYVSYPILTVEGSMVTVNAPYPSTFQVFVDEKTLNKSFKLNTTQLEEVEQLANGNSLVGKIGAFNGDSIMAGAGFTGGFAKIIAEKNNMVYENIAVGGGTITAGTNYQDGRERHWVSRTISEMRSDGDYAIILAGVNDGALGVPMGEYTSGYGDTYDDTTFCGAVESTCSQLVQRFSGKKIGFIIPHKMSPAQETYVPKLIEGLKKWGVPYLNLYELVPSLNNIPHLKENYTSNADGWHPNELGYRRYYVDKIEAWMKTL